MINSRIFIRKMSNNIQFSKVLVLKKYTRYEKLQKTYDTEGRNLDKCLQESGWNVDKILASHKIQQTFEENMKNELVKADIEYKFVTKNEYTEKEINWADAILTLGGDGTFLQAANKIKERNTMLIGFNSMPDSSTGHLCLPKYFSQHLDEAISKIKQGKFKHLYRTRIQVSLLGNTASHAIHCDKPPSRPRTLPDHDPKDFRILPELALNDVFVGEYMSALVSKLIVSLNKDTSSKQIKCSGICINTGSGSTAWHYTINHLTEQKVEQILSLARVNQNQWDIKDITNKYNRSLQFNPDDSRLSYTIRDIIGTEDIEETGFIQKMKLKSMCTNGAIVIDGNVSYDFLPGAEIWLETHPDYDLNTIVLS